MGLVMSGDLQAQRTNIQPDKLHERPGTWRRYKILQVITNTAELINCHKDRQQPLQFVDFTISKNRFEHMLDPGKIYYPEDVDDCRNSIHLFLKRKIRIPFVLEFLTISHREAFYNTIFDMLKFSII